MTAELPKTPAGRHLGWVLDAMTSAPPVAEVKKRLSAQFLAQVPAETFVQLMEQVSREMKGFVLDRFERESQRDLVGIIEIPNGSAFRLSLAVDDQHITGLLIQPAFDLAKEPAATSWEELERKLVASKRSFLAAEVVNDDLVPIFDIAPDEPLAIGSTFKLYVLGALARAVEAGDVSWDDELAVRANAKSIPSGEMQNEKAGTKHSLKHFALKMISISDNTATDHIIDLLGRERVEAMLEPMGNAHADRNVPFLKTREMALLKLVPKHATAYLKAKDKRAFLDGIAKTKLPKIDHPAGWPEPRHVDEIEWYASANDLGRAMIWLRREIATTHGEPVKEIIGTNPGLPFDRYAWSYIGFKGGGEPGVLNMTWLLKRLDERWFVLSCGLNDDGESDGGSDPTALMMSAAALLVMQRRKVKKKKR